MVASTTAAPAPTPSEPATANLASSLANGENNGGSNSRLSNTTACLPFVYGSVAFFQGKKADEYHTHKWTLYLRGASDEDISGCISKIIFQLHPSFTQPVRELLEPPFEVTERGWGEFEAQIRIVWKDPQEKATVVSAVNARF
jgi:YEATS domain-containing protein 4